MSSLYQKKKKKKKEEEIPAIINIFSAESIKGEEAST
jgi:hypothetical protein